MWKQTTKSLVGIAAIGFLYHKIQKHVSFGNEPGMKNCHSNHLVLAPSISTIKLIEIARTNAVY